MILILGKPEPVFKTVFASRFTNSGFEVKQEQGGYGGGLLYQVKQNTFVRYLNLVPTKDGTGVLVVVWNRSPTK